MSKKLKLETLSTTRSLRSRTIPGQSEDLTSETSKFFDEDVEEEKNPDTKSKTVKSKSKKRSPIKIQCDDDDDDNDEKVDENGALTKDKEQWMPKNWETVLKNIREMRKKQSAPVDDMGCHKCADTNVSEPIFRYQSLVALMLSSQTKDQVTFAAMQRLRDFGCTPDSIAAVSHEKLGKLIHPVGFWKSKVEYLKRTSQILLEEYNGDIPDTVEKLCKLPGVGPKMAYICMQVAWKKNLGIGVDTHVHRISNRMGWTRKITSTPEKTRKDLESWLPKELWAEVNHLLVGFGQTICTPQRPKCTECLNKDVCPYPRKKTLI